MKTFRRTTVIPCPKYPNCGSVVILTDDIPGEHRVSVVRTDIEWESIDTRWFTNPNRAYIAYAFDVIRETKAWRN